MVKIVNGVIEGYGLYEIKDTLKYYGCTWDMDSKKWSAPINQDKIKLFFDKLNKQKLDESEEYWKEACEKCGYKFVKKGTSEYNEVKEEMTRIMRQVALDKKLKKDDRDETF